MKTTTTYKFHLYRFYLTLAALALFLLALVAPATAHQSENHRAPDLGACQDLQAPAGNKVAFHVYAEGVQIYRWNGTSWSFVAPDATMFADARANGVIGTHYAGPTWESVSGSKVVSRLFKQPCVANPDAIPWLLLEAVTSHGPGIFDGVTFIQRVNTVGGKAPTYPGGSLNEEARVPYTTEYYFYRGQD